MRISTSTYSVSYCAENKTKAKDQKEVLKAIKAAGYGAADIGLFDWKKEDFMLWGDDWRDKVKDFGEFAQSIGIPLTQGHAPFVGSKEMRILDTDNEISRLYFEMLHRSIEAAGILGVKWLTVHPYHDFENNMERAAGMKKNHKIYDALVYRAGELGFGISFENMLHNSEKEYMCRFCENYDDLIAFVDSFNCENVGITWDFGHANTLKFNQAVALRHIGKRLKALHINDNRGVRDDHLYPYLGNVDWESTVPVLKEIGYSGDFTLEVPGMLKYLPECVQQKALEMGVPICRKLMKIAGLE